MYQPEVKLEFVLHNCKPSDGWHVYVDIDSSEKGETGGERKTDEAKNRQKEMKEQAQKVVTRFGELGVQVNGGLKVWLNDIKNNKGLRLPEIFGDRDIVALNLDKQEMIIAEVEGEPSGQPEQKLYKAIGQMVMCVSQTQKNGWEVRFIIAVFGEGITKHLAKATCLKNIGVSGLSIKSADKRWQSVI